MAAQGSETHASKLLAATLRAAITDGTYLAGSRLPSYRKLRDEHDVALNTAQAAVRILAAEGLVEIRPGSGAYVRDSSGDGTVPLRSELTELRAALRQTRKDLAIAEEKVASLLSRLPPDEAIS